MKGESRFFRTRGGLVAYAQVAVFSEPAAASTIEWPAKLETMKRVWGQDVERGIQLAAAAREKRGGGCHRIHVEQVVDIPADTKPDAMTCAAAIAAWKSWGGSEDDLSVTHDDGTWRVQFD